METAKRALEIAAAGGHNLLLVGPPGAGKSHAGRAPARAAARPDAGRGARGQHDPQRRRHAARRPPGDARRPFREPHHSAVAGGADRRRPARAPGEVSLAHRGVLFLDELPEFPRPALEALRQPVETGRTTVARAAAHVTYPARFQLVAAMNPCRCGHLGDAARECGSAPRCGEDYLRAASAGPLLDRIDLTSQVQPVRAAELSRAPPAEPIAAGRRPRGARARVQPPLAGAGVRTNAEADGDARSLASPRTAARWPSRRPSSCGCRRAASPACCGSRAPSPTWPVRRRCGGSTWPRRWRSGIVSPAACSTGRM